jgi:hypothetical protein
VGVVVAVAAAHCKIATSSFSTMITQGRIISSHTVAGLRKVVMGQQQQQQQQ